MRSRVVKVAVMLGFLVFSAAAALAAEGDKKNVVHAGPSFMLPTGSQVFEVDNASARVRQQNALGISVGYQRMIKRRFALGVEVSRFTGELESKRLGVTTKFPDFDITPIVFSGTWHTGSKFDIYGGPAIAYILNSDYKSDLTLGAVAGINFSFGNKGWALHADMKYLHASVEGEKDDPIIGKRVPFDTRPFVFSAGIAYSF